MPFIKLLLAAAVALTLTGCATSPYDDRYLYHPRPTTLETVAPDQVEAGSVRTLVTVVGVRRADRDPDDGLPASIHVRIRLDNTARADVEFDPRSVDLFGGDVRQFPEPILRPPELIVLEPGDTGTLDAYFPLPGGRIPGNMDLSGLGVRWMLRIDGHEAPGSATFARRELDVRYRDPGPRFNVGFGVHHHRFRRW